MTTSCIPVGSIPTEIGRLINLKCLYLQKNKLTGKRPISNNFAIGRPFYHMIFDDVMLAVGSIPTEIARLVKLTELNLVTNKLTGKRPISRKIANGRPVYHKTF